METEEEDPKEENEMKWSRVYEVKYGVHTKYSTPYLHSVPTCTPYLYSVLILRTCRYSVLVLLRIMYQNGSQKAAFFERKLI